jgi:YD repeat-containing protein
MTFSALRRGLAVALLGLAAHLGAAQAAEVKTIKQGDWIMAMDGERLISRFNEVTNESNQYFYISGLIWQASSSNGTVTTYSYDADGKLLRIETTRYTKDRDGKPVPTSVTGTNQQAIYAGKTLVALASSTGKRLAFGQAQAGEAVVRVKSKGSKIGQMSKAPTKASRVKDFNNLLIGIGNWDIRPADWDCLIAPDGNTICTGHPPPAEPYDPGPPPIDTPPSDGGGEVGGGGGGDAGATNPQIPTDLPTRESCYAAAHNTYWIMMNQVCKFPKNRKSCEANAFLIFEDQMAECTAKYPF